MGNATSRTYQIWMRAHCFENRYYFHLVISLSSVAQTDRPWPRKMIFVKSLVVECVWSSFATSERWVVLIYRPHAVIFSQHSGFDEPLLSPLCLRWQEASRSTARRWSSWTTVNTLQGLASICFTQLCCFYVGRRMRGSGSANLIYSSRLAAASNAGGCLPLVHLKRCC